MKRKNKHNIFYIFLGSILLIPACITEYNPDITRYENVLVVDGNFNNLDEDHYLKLARTFGYYEYKEEMETGAVIAVMDDQGNSAYYNEISDGNYKLDKGDMEAVTGRCYKVIIETKDGKRYESDFDTLKKPVAIDSVYYEIEEDLPGENNSTYDGLQLYLDTRDETNSTHYYRWDWVETWEFVVPFDKPGYETRKKCWRTVNSTNITLANTLQLKEDYVYKKKLYFVPSTNNKLSRIYSTNIRQYALSAEAYDFWRQLEISNEQTGSLFDPPPTPVTGNVQNVDDPYEPVLGYFEVAGASEKRIFIQRKDLPPTVDLTTGNEHCTSETVMGEGIDELQHGWYLLLRYEWMDTIWTQLSSHIDCYDCTMRGSNDKPDFWIETENE